MQSNLYPQTIGMKKLGINLLPVWDMPEAMPPWMGGLENLQNQLEAIEKGSPGNRLYYLSVAPQLYPEITKNLGKLGMASSVEGSASNSGWRRLIIEKPFGHDLSTAKA